MSYNEMFVGAKVTPIKAPAEEYAPSPGDLVTFAGNRQVYSIERVSNGQVVYKLLDGLFADSEKNLQRLGMERL